MASIIAYLKVVLIAQLFYACTITMIVYTLPPDVLGQFGLFQAPADKFSEKYITSSIEQTAGQEMNLATIDMSSLMYYSGNIVFDLLANFATAVPQMLSILITGLLYFFAVDTTVISQLRTFFYGMIMIAYVVAIISFLMGARSQGAVV